MTTAYTAAGAVLGAPERRGEFMQATELKTLVLEALEELKSVDVVTMDVSANSGFTDYMMVVTGTSNRHVKSLSDNLQRRCRDRGLKALGVEGEQGAEWILLDLGDVVVHVMQPQIRAFYNLEKLWSFSDRSDVTTSVQQQGQQL